MDLPCGCRRLNIGEKIITGDVYYSTVGKWESCDNIIGHLVPNSVVVFARTIGHNYWPGGFICVKCGANKRAVELGRESSKCEQVLERWMLINLALGDKEIKVNVPMNASVEYDNYLNALRYVEQAVYQLFFGEKPSAQAANDTRTAPVRQEYVGEAPAPPNS